MVLGLSGVIASSYAITNTFSERVLREAKGIQSCSQMKIGKPKSAYDEFSQKYRLEIHFSSSQEDLFKEDDVVVLTHEQMDDVVNQISANYGLAEFLESNATEIRPVSMSLFVLNDALWKIMEKKPWDKDKMLAMSTIPYCFWDKNEESASNPKCVKRWDLGFSKMSFVSDPPTISITGDGGDFCGYIEQSMLTSRKFGLPETRRLIPNYQYTRVEVTAWLSDASIQTYPLPMKNLDYDFSAGAKEFYNRGIQLNITGEQVTLNVEKRNPSKLKGDVHFLVAATIEEEKKEHLPVLADIWFWALSRFLEDKR